MTDATASPDRDRDTLDWRDFLVDRPPGTRAHVDRAAYAQQPHPSPAVVHLPELQLYCDGACKNISYCKGQQFAIGKLFGGIEREQLPTGNYVEPTKNVPHDVVLCYSCEKCGRVVKSYSVRFWSVAASWQERELVDVQKIAEWPFFSPRTPSKVTSLVGPDRDLFLKGRRAEIEQLGIGAFSYYRRIVEGQKNRLLDEIIRVARHLGVPAKNLARLEAAKVETQFSKAVDSVKEAIPPVLYIKGHNPFTLLHGALSEGLHAASDEKCLVAASDIRLILVEFAERLTEAMKDQKELDEALSRLVNPKT
jgi:hypothetical protein